MTKEEAKIIKEQIHTLEHYIVTIVTSHTRALRELIEKLTQKE